jgi:hypothetical protein
MKGGTEVRNGNVPDNQATIILGGKFFSWPFLHRLPFFIIRAPMRLRFGNTKSKKAVLLVVVTLLHGHAIQKSQ